MKTFDGMQVVVEVDPDNSDKENPSFLSCGVWWKGTRRRVAWETGILLEPHC